MPDRCPVIVGVAQFNPRRAGLSEAPEPLDMMARVAQAAAEDCGAPAILKSLDALAVVNIISFSYPNAPAALAARLGIDPAAKVYTTIGGNTPQYLINHFSAEVAAGRIRAAMVVGAEAFYTLRRAMRRGPVKWGAAAGDGKPAMMGDTRAGTTALEERYGARLPSQVYPLFENARRASHGWSIEAHREKLGRMCAAMTCVASTNPYAWFPEERSAEEITTVSAANRMICFPYPKLMNSIIDVDLAAAVIVASEEEAHRLNVAADRMVYVAAGAEATERGYFISERDNYHSSPALKRAAEKCLELAGVSVAEVGYFDFYSCFPVAVELALDALSLDAEDPRGVTVTGGLPYAGGPGNNYCTHSIAAMVERLRSDRSKIGMVTALGWYLTKHAAAVYSGERPSRSYRRDNSQDTARGAAPSIEITEQADGPATVETYTVVHDRGGEPAEAIVVGRLDNGARLFARAPREVLGAMESEEFVGRRGRVRLIDGLNFFEPR